MYEIHSIVYSSVIIKRTWLFMIPKLVFLVTGAIIALSCSCKRVPPADDSRVVSLIQKRITKQVHWRQETKEDQQVISLMQQLFQKELELDAAIQIALLNNPTIQATFEELGIAQADLVQAGLLQNPFFQGFVRFPNQRSLATNTEFSITQNILELFLIPLRKKIAATELAQAQLRVANVILEVHFDVQKSYYSLQAEQTRLSLLESLLETTEMRKLLAEKQYQAGNINELELQRHTSVYLEAKLNLSKSQAEIAGLQRTMNVLLGLRDTQTNWHIAQGLPNLPGDEPPLAQLETRALSERLDIAIIRLEINRIAQIGATKNWWAYTDVAVGISGEKDSEGPRVLGPMLLASLPLFNTGQADRARLTALLKQNQHRLKAVEIDILSQVRLAKERLAIYRNLVSLYMSELLPLQKKIIATSQNFYNVMGLSVYKLLQSKQQELLAKIEYTTSLRDYWTTRVELDRAVGGSVIK